MYLWVYTNDIRDTSKTLLSISNMQQGLKQKIENLQVEVRLKERELMMTNTFQGAGQVDVIVNDTLGKALGLKKEGHGYVLGSVNTNGALQYTEDRIQEMISQLSKESSGAKMHTILL